MQRIFLLFTLHLFMYICCRGQASHVSDGYFYLVIQKSVSESPDHYAETVSSQLFFADSLNEADFNQRYMYDGVHLLKPAYRKITNTTVYRSGTIHLGGDVLFDLVSYPGLYADFLPSQKGTWVLLFRGSSILEPDSCQQYHLHQRLGLQCVSFSRLPEWEYLGYKKPDWPVVVP